MAFSFAASARNPNNFVNTDGRLTLDVTWNFKLQAVYKLPAGFLISANLTHRDNAWTVRRASGRSTAVAGFPEGTTLLLQKRGETDRLPKVTFLDMRLQKDFRFGKDLRFSVFADALNLLNNDSYEGVQSSTVTSDVFLWPAAVVNPRRIMLGAKFRF